MPKRTLLLIPALALGIWFVAALHLDWPALFRGDLEAGTASLRAAAETYGAYKTPAMALMIALLPLMLVPISLLMLAAAAFLPPAEAMFAMMSGTTVNNVLAWSLGHFFGRRLSGFIGLDRLKLIQSLKSGAADHGFKMALFSRCLPIPFSVTGVATAMIGIGFWQMVLGTLAMMLPWAVIYIFFVEAVKQGNLRYVGAGVLALALALLVTGWLRKKAAQQTADLPGGPLKPQSPALGPVLTLYTLADHDASEDARRELWALRTRFGFEVDEIVLGGDEALLKKHQDHAPLLFLGERRLFSFQVDENALEQYLKAHRD